MKSTLPRMGRILQGARALWGNLNPLNRGPLSFERAQRPGFWPPPVFRAGRWLADDSDEHRSHWAISGAACSGKSLLLALYLRSLVPQLTPGSNRRLVLFDSDNYLHGSLFDYARVPVHYFLPGHRLTSRWDLAGGDFATPGAVMRLCQALVPEAQGDCGSTFFDQACRGLMGGVIRSLNATQPGWSLTDVIRTLDYRESTAEVLARGDHTRSLLRYMDEPRTYAAIAAMMQERLDPLHELAIMWSRASQVFSLRDFLQKEGILVLGCDPDLPALGPLNMLLFTELFSELLARGDSSSSRTYLVFDGLIVDGNKPLPGLSDVLLRGPSRGVVVAATFQSYADMKAIYKDGADAILDLLEERVFLRVPDLATANYALRAFRKWYQQIDVSGEHRASLAADINALGNFLTLPFATAKDGITGYRLSPHARGGRHAFHLPGRWIAANRPKGGKGDASEA